MSRFLRFYSPDLPNEADQLVVLSAEESNHLVRVLRLGPGAAIELFDGKGGSATAEVVDANRSRATCLLQSPRVIEKPTSPSLRLAVVPPKSDFSDLVVRAAELGVSEILPLMSDAGEVSYTRKNAHKLIERFHRLAVRAAKQSGRNTLIRVARQQAFDAVCGTNVYFCTLQGEVLSAASLPDLPGGECTIVVGPEGGWSQREEELALHRNWQRTRLPGGVLRTMTAALAAIATIQAAAGWRSG